MTPNIDTPPRHSALNHPRPAIVLLLIATLLAAGCDRLSGLRGTAEPRATLTLLDGRVLELGRMGQPVLVNFWSTSCAICIEDLPALSALYERYAPSGVEFVAVAMPGDPPNEVLELATTRRLPFPVAIDIDGQVLDAFDRVYGTPTSFLLDAAGAVVMRHAGALDREQLSRALDQVLETAPANSCQRDTGRCSG